MTITLPSVKTASNPGPAPAAAVLRMRAASAVRRAAA